KWFGKAALKGEPAASTALALLHLNGEGVAQDAAKAEELLRQAADRGHGPALVQLGHLCSSREAVSADNSDAIRWYGAAAEDGQGIGQDVSEALSWYKRAAERGLAEAQLALGDLCYSGVGMSRNEEAARHWYELAAKGGSDTAAKRLGDLAERAAPGGPAPSAQ